jgi:Calcineurin-like phosphoesterase
VELRIPDFALVLLLGGLDATRAAFAAGQFRPGETVAAADLAAVAQRLAARELTVVDAAGMRREDRVPLLRAARRCHAPRVAIVLDTAGALRGMAKGLAREGFGTVHTLRSIEAIAAAQIARIPLACDRRGEHGPFDIIGDVHGCRDELEWLLQKLGYAPGTDGAWKHPQQRRTILLGDLVDRGPDVPGVLRLVLDMVAAGSALAVPGNHDLKLVRKLQGHAVQVNAGLAASLAQLAALPAAERACLTAALPAFFTALPSHLWLDDGNLVAAHAGLAEDMHGRCSAKVLSFALYGETGGETDGFGLPVQRDWAARYRGAAAVVYGHTSVRTARWVSNTICLDTGCVFGGRLTALRYPERELVDVPAARPHFASGRPLR